MKKIYGILCIMFCFFWAGCDEDSVIEETGFDIVERNANFTAAGGTLTATLSVEGDNVQSDQDWCTASISGKTVTVTMGTNLNLEGRTALITVTKGTTSISFPVTQGGNKAPIAEEKSITFDARGGTQELQVEHVTPFTAIPAASWVTAKVEGSVLILTTSTNYSIDELSTTVKLVSGDLESEILVSQTGIKLIPAKTELAMSNAGDETTVLINSTLPFTAVSDQEWLIVSKDDNSVTLKAGDNSGQPLRTANVTLKSETLIATITVSQSLYSDYLGDWTLTGMDGLTPFTYNLIIEQETMNSTYKVTGWGKSGVANNSDHAILANFDAETGLIYITGQGDLGTYDNAYRIVFYGQVDIGGTIYYLGGTNYICYIGSMQSNGSVKWANGYDPVNGFDVVGGKYMLVSLENENSVAAFNVDTPFMRQPTMVKSTSTSTFTKSLMKRDDSIEHVTNSVKLIKK